MVHPHRVEPSKASDAKEREDQHREGEEKVGDLGDSIIGKQSDIPILLLDIVVHIGNQSRAPRRHLTLFSVHAVPQEAPSLEGDQRGDHEEDGHKDDEKHLKGFGEVPREEETNPKEVEEENKKEDGVEEAR